MTTYQFERIHTGSLSDIQYLYKVCFNIHVSLAHLKAKYNTKSFGKEVIGYIAYDENRQPSAYYGVFPMQLRYENEIYTVGQSGDTMTHPQHQKKGLFIQLAQKTYETAKNEGFAFIFGFPNQNSYPGFVKKLAWEFHDCMYDFNFQVKTIPLAGAAMKYSFLRNFYKRYINFIYSSSEDIDYQTFNKEREIGIEKNQAFYAYKQSLGSILMDVKGVPVWLKFEGRLIVGDFLENHITDSAAFLAEIKRIARWAGCRKIVFTYSPNNHIFSLLSNLKEGEKSLPIGFLALNGEFDFAKISFSRLDYDTF